LNFRAIDPCISLVSRAFKRQFVLPEFHKFCKEIETIYENCKSNTDGNVSKLVIAIDGKGLHHSAKSFIQTSTVWAIFVGEKSVVPFPMSMVLDLNMINK
jgi:hypothetical protein